MDLTTLTIIIPHLGLTPEIEYAFDKCYESLKETVPDIRILVAKNGKVGCLHERDIRIIEQGQCKAVNAAVAISSTPWVLVTNDDMVYPPRWWENLTTGFSEGSDKILCISPKLIEPRSGAPTFEVYFCGGTGGDFDKEKWLEFAKNYQGQGLRTGFNLPFLIKKELWDLVGGYDVNFDPWGSNGDSDLEYKIRLAGVQPYQNRNSIVYHFSQTSGTFHPDNRDYWQDNWNYFIQKWGFPRTDEGIWEANFHIPTKEEGRIFQPDWEEKYGRVY